MKLRAHHIYCLPFSKIDFRDRGEDYVRAQDKIKQTMCRESEEPVEIVVGVDELCQACPLCRDNRCQSPEGDEEEVRKWDSIIFNGLGVSVGTTLTASAWRELIRQKSPLDFCCRCRLSSYCDIVAEYTI